MQGGLIHAQQARCGTVGIGHRAVEGQHTVAERAQRGLDLLHARLQCAFGPQAQPGFGGAFGVEAVEGIHQRVQLVGLCTAGAALQADAILVVQRVQPGDGPCQGRQVAHDEPADDDHQHGGNAGDLGQLGDGDAPGGFGLLARSAV